VLILIPILAIVTFGAFSGLLMSGIINREIVSGIDIMNADGNKTALVVYQPGFSSFPRDVSYAFAEGLASSGWRVELTTASPQAPSNFSKYSLLVLGFPSYGGTPGTAIVSYVNRVKNLDGLSTVIVSCAGGISTRSIETLKQQLQAANGTFYDGLALSNQDSAAIGSARQTGSTILP